ncbi:MAG TPA: hypothetical protein VH092_35930 [Urbifossiella sp.]|nr:hypothetical protein [Urbifossiella sp.]
MRNRHDSGSPSGWWDDLPPRVKARFAGPPPAAVDPEPPAPPAAPTPARPSSLEWVRELSRVALLFLAVAVANVLFLLVALSFLGHGRPAVIPAH